MGEFECRLSEIVGKGTYVGYLKLKGSRKKSTISSKDIIITDKKRKLDKIFFFLVRSQEVPHTNVIIFFSEIHAEHQ